MRSFDLNTFYWLLKKLNQSQHVKRRPAPTILAKKKKLYIYLLNIMGTSYHAEMN